MDDSHRLLHRALEAYFEPDEFRMNVQSCLQMLRSVTFVLQKQRKLFQRYDAWYFPWQQRFRQDSIMRWLVDSRNKSIKQEDLNAFSFLHARIIASYRDLPDLNVTAGLWEGLRAMLARADPVAREKQLLEHGVLQIERRWIDEKLPDYELLTALGYAYGQLDLLFRDAHRELGLPVNETATLLPGAPHAFSERRMFEAFISR